MNYREAWANGEIEAGTLVDAIEEQSREIERLQLTCNDIDDQNDRIYAELAALKAQPDPWKASGADWCSSIHSNPDAKAWADCFVAVFPGQADKYELMFGWFANAMMAMHDHLKAQPSGVVDAQRLLDWNRAQPEPRPIVIGREYQVAEACARLNSSPVSAGNDAQYPPCDYCAEPLSYHPWHGSGLINGVESRHIHACDKCRHLLPTVSAGGVDERVLYEQSCKERAASNGRAYEAHYFKRPAGVGEYLNPGAEHGWQVWQQARAALSANHSEQVREVCRHEFSDDGEFTVHCSKCDLTINAEPPRHVLDSAAQQAFEAGGTEDGSYVLTGDDLDQIVAQACAMAVIEFAAAPSAGSQGGDV